MSLEDAFFATLTALIVAGFAVLMWHVTRPPHQHWRVYYVDRARIDSVTICIIREDTALIGRRDQRRALPQRIEPHVHRQFDYEFVWSEPKRLN